ncbi:MAG: tetratricopeptide repeat protein [Acidobacteriota bacterium]
MPAPQSIRHYKILREISKGGMAQVYLAKDEKENRHVALKVLLPHIAEDQEFRLRFRHEVQAHQALRHPNVVELYDWGDDEHAFMAMELMDAMTLKRMLGFAKRLPPEVATFIVSEVLKGLGYAHEMGVVHRDVKPSNIMISKAGKVKIADFGIATGETFTRLTQTGNIIGTPAYMSPEQARGEHTDKRTDLFAMGVILYELLVGQNPYHTEHPATTLKRVIDAAQLPIFELNPSIPPELEAVVDNLMEKNVIRRYGDAGEALKDLETVRSARLSRSFEEADMVEFVKDPGGSATQIEKDASEKHFQKGIELYKEGKGSPDLAIWELYQAVVIDPSHEQARNSLEIISEQRGYRLQASEDPEIKQLKDKLEKEPYSANTLVRLAKAYKKEGNFLQVIRCYVRLRKLQTQDRYLLNQMNTLVGVENLDAFDRTHSLVARRQSDPVAVAPGAAGPAVASDIAPGAAIPGPRLKLPPRPEDRPPDETFLKMVLKPQVILAVGAVLIVGFVVRMMVSPKKDADPLVNPGELAADIKEKTDELAPEASGPGSEPDGILDRAAGQASGRTVSRSEQLYRRFLEKFPGHPREGEAILGLARALEAQGEHDEALKVTYDGMPKIKTPELLVQAHTFRATILKAQGRTDDALNEYKAIQALNDPKASPAALLTIAETLRDEGRLDEALREVDGLLGFYGKSEVIQRARMLKAEILVGLKRGKEALALLNEIQSNVGVESAEYKAARKLADHIRAQDEPTETSPEAHGYMPEPVAPSDIVTEPAPEPEPLSEPPPSEAPQEQSADAVPEPVP